MLRSTTATLALATSDSAWLMSRRRRTVGFCAVPSAGSLSSGITCRRNPLRQRPSYRFWSTAKTVCAFGILKPIRTSLQRRRPIVEGRDGSTSKNHTGGMGLRIGLPSIGMTQTAGYVPLSWDL